MYEVTIEEKKDYLKIINPNYDYSLPNDFYEKTVALGSCGSVFDVDQNGNTVYDTNGVNVPFVMENEVWRGQIVDYILCFEVASSLHDLDNTDVLNLINKDVVKWLSEKKDVPSNLLYFIHPQVELDIIKEIKENGLEQTVQKYNLVMRSDKLNSDIISLCYHQTETPKNHITNQCRGIVIDTNTMRVISYPFYRFNDFDFKKGELDLKNGVFYEKIDGSICTLHYYNGSWRISTKSTPNGSGFIKRNESRTFSDYFFTVFDRNILRNLDQTLCYMFEFKFPSENHHLIPTIRETTTLIGVRDLITMKEISISNFTDKFNTPKPITFDSIIELKKFVYNLDPIITEGLVYVSNDLDQYGNFKRFKVKSPQFEIIQNLRFAVNEENRKLNTKWLTEILFINSHRSFLLLDKFKHFQDEVNTIDKYIKTLFEQYEESKNLTDHKQIGLLNIDQKVKTYMFKKLKGETKSFSEFLSNI